MLNLRDDLTPEKNNLQIVNILKLKFSYFIYTMRFFLQVALFSSFCAAQSGDSNIPVYLEKEQVNMDKICK